MLKRIVLYWISVAVAVCLCACDSGGKTANINSSDFVCSINITLDGYTFSGEMTRPAKGCCTVSITEPSIMDGLTLSVTDCKAKVTYDGISFDVPEKYSRYLSALTAMVDALDAATDVSTLSIKHDGNKTVYSGTSNSGEFQLTAYSSGMPSSMYIPDLDLKVDFIERSA